MMRLMVDCFAAEMTRTAIGGKILTPFTYRLSKQSRSEALKPSIS
jgi:hypothetical protein